MRAAAHIFLRILFPFALFLAPLVVTLRFLDWNQFKDDVATMLTRRLGSTVEINGGLDVDLGNPLRIQLRGLTLAAPSGGALLQIGKLQATVPLRSLFDGTLVIEQLEITAPEVLVKRDVEGKLNWSAVKSHGQAAKKLPVVENFLIRGGGLTYRDAALSDDIRLAIDKVTGSIAREGAINVSGTGSLGGRPLRIQLDATRNTQNVWQVQTATRVADTRLAVRGSLSGPDLHVELSTPDLARLNFLPLVQFPHVNDVRFASRIARDGGQWWLDNLELNADGHRLDGDIRVDLDRQPRLLYATLYLDELRVPNRTGQSRNENIIPAVPIDLSPLRAVEGRLRLSVGKITNAPISVRNMHLTAALRRGALTIAPFSAALAGGVIDGELVLDSKRSVPSVTLHLALRDLALQPFVPKATSQGVQGNISGRIDVGGKGKTLKQALSDIDGEVIFLVRDGAIRASWLEAVRLDLAEWLLLRATPGTSEKSIRCGFIAFTANDGVLLARPVIIDTQDGWLTANGFIDLEYETLQLTIRSHPKDFSPLSAQAPITVVGPFRHLSVDVSTDRLLGRGAAALALGTLLSPIAGWIPFIEPGFATDRNCRQLLADVPLGNSSASR